MRQKMFFISLAILLPVVLWAAGPPKMPQEFHHLGLEHGLSQSSVYCILQDSKGFMWFGTSNGLNKYDGKNFKVYRNDCRDFNSLSHNIVYYLAETNDGAIWVATGKTGLNRFDPRSETFTRYRYEINPETGKPKTITNDIIRALYRSKDGKLWIGTKGGILNCFDPSTGNFSYYLPGWEAKAPLSVHTIFSLFEDKKGILWIGSRNGLLRFDRQTESFTKYVHREDDPDSISHNVVLALDGDDQGYLWVGTVNGLNRMDTATGKFTHYFYRADDSSSLSYPAVSKLLVDRNNNVWAGTPHGLCYLDRQSNKFQRYDRESNIRPGRLRCDFIHSLYESDSGIIWIGTLTAGIQMVDPNRNLMNLYSNTSYSPIKLSDHDISVVLEDYSGYLWVGTRQRGLNRVNRQTGEVKVFEYNPKDPGALQHHSITALAVSPSGTLWVGTGGGVHRLNRETGKFTNYRFQKGNRESLSSNLVQALCVGPRGKLWVATYTGGLNCLDPETEKVTRYLHQPEVPGSLSSADAISLLCDRKGTIWVGTMRGGLNRFNAEDGTFTHYRFSRENADSISGKDAYSLYEDEKGYLWVGLGGEGLDKFDRESQTFTHYGIHDGLPDGMIYAILGDRQGRLWISSNRGISRFSPDTGEIKNYDLSAGLQGYEYNLSSACRCKNGEMFFGGIQGLNSFFPDKMVENKHVPPIVLTKFKLFHLKVPIGEHSLLKHHISFTDEITLSYRENMFSLEFAALDYSNPSKNRYQYKMEGFHKDWIMLREKNDITFTGLEPGEYTFRVKGSNNDGLWNPEGASLKIVITPPFWGTWWFRSLALLCAIGMLVIWHRSRLNHATLQLQTESKMNRIFARYGISEREQEIVQLVLKGKSNSDIEKLLFISMPTVKRHIYNIYKKVGVKNRLELINLFQKSLAKKEKEGAKKLFATSRQKAV